MNDYWDEFHNRNEVDYISDAFKIMHKFKKDIVLDEYEIDILYNKLWSNKIKTAGKRSSLVENALQKAFTILRTDPSYNIYGIENNPQIRIKDNSKYRTIRPDVVITLASKYNIGEMKKIEFQVKIYEEKSSVLTGHIKTSKNLLEQKKIDFVYFVTTSDFSKTLISELTEKFPNRVGGVYPLTKSQQAYLSLLVFYEEIFSRKLNPSYVKLLLKSSLGIDIGEFFENVKRLPKISITPKFQPTLEIFERPKIETSLGKPPVIPVVPEIIPTEKSVTKAIPEQKVKKIYPNAIEDILLFMYRRTGRYEWQSTFNYLKGKLTNFRDEEVKEGFRWLKKESEYIENISSASIKLNINGINLLKSLKKI